MESSEVEKIKEIIEDLLELRQKRYDEHIDLLTRESHALDMMNDSASRSFIEEAMIELGYKKEENPDTILEEFISDFDRPLVKLNNLLSIKERNQKVIEIEQQLARLNSKKILTVKEFNDKYNIGKTSQQNYRQRLHDPLPYHQKVEGGKITYNVEEVERWLENQYK